MATKYLRAFYFVVLFAHCYIEKPALRLSMCLSNEIGKYVTMVMECEHCTKTLSHQVVRG